MLKRLVSIAILSSVGISSSAQMSYDGDATEIFCGCADITQDAAGENGSMHSAIPLDLTSAWVLTFDVTFGSDDAGGEGLAFVMQTGPWANGAGGAGLGYEGIAGDVMACEFDTRDNDAPGEVANNDVTYDHISLQDNGDTDNNPLNPNNLLGIVPLQIKPGFPDVEDGVSHSVQITWTPGAVQTFEVQVDAAVALTYSADIVTNQFSGTTSVLWGWTGSTNVATNLQTVCRSLPTIDIDADAEYCDGDPIADLTVLSAITGTVNWYNNPALTPSLGVGPTFTPSSAVADLYYYATDSDPFTGCEGEPDSVFIEVNPIPPAPILTGTVEYCEDEIPTPLSAETSYSGDVTWYDGPPPATILSSLDDYNPPTAFPGSFTFYVTETAEGCEGPADSITVLIKPEPAPPVVTGTMVYCEGDIPTPLTASVTSGGTIEWKDTGGGVLGTGLTYTPTLILGTMYLVVTETLDGCASEDTTITIQVEPNPVVDVPDVLIMCAGDSVYITADNNGYNLLWETGEINPSIWYKPGGDEYVWITCTNPDCGFDIDSVFLDVNALPSITVYSDTAIGIGGEVQLTAESANDVVYSWTPPVDECVTSDCSVIYDVPDQATVYVVMGTDQNGCVNYDTVLVDITGKMEVFVPNVFSPNNDGWNDVLLVRGPKLDDYSFEIYDRYGKRIFVSKDQREGWDGTINGNELAPQTFVYMLSGETILGEVIVLEGNVSIIK